MNVLGLMLLGSIVHATGFGVLGVLVYLALRRRGPAAGSLAAGSTLTIMVLVSMVVLSPWPRWWTVAPESFVTTAVRHPKAPEPIEPSSTAPQASELLARLSSDPSKDSRPAEPPNEITPQPTLLSFLLEELRRPTINRAPSRWGWPEWLATGFLASLALGLIRLGLGFWGMTRLRARSVPIDDRKLHDAIEILRAELSCRRSIEVRELGEMSTPATVGWRRPLLLLPADWRDWSLDERRAVLAHELAPCAPGRFPDGARGSTRPGTALLSSPRALAGGPASVGAGAGGRRLGARLSGGKPLYLATLAQMALRRDSRAMTWPARAFLPSHDTFVRRIEMLRNTKQIRPGSLSFSVRFLTVGGLAGLGLLVAGLRGPAGDAPALAQAQPIAQLEGGGAQDAVNAYNLAFLPVDTKMMLTIRPGRLLHRRDVGSLINSMRNGNPLGKALVVPPEDIEQLLVFWTTEAEIPPGGNPPFSGLVLRMTKPQEWKAIVGQVLGTHQQEARHDGQAYIRTNPNGPKTGGIYMPDDRTLVVAEEGLLRELIEDRNAPAPRHPWDEAWTKVAKGQVMLALDTRWLRRRIAQSQQGDPATRGPRADAMLKLETFSPLWEKARSYALGINATDKGLTVNLVAGAGSDQDAKPVAETIQAMVTLGKNALQGLRQDLRRPVAGGEGMEWLLQAAGSLLEKAQRRDIRGVRSFQRELPRQPGRRDQGPGPGRHDGPGLREAFPERQ